MKIEYSKLTKEQKLNLIDAIKEKKTRLKKRSNHYTPNVGQLERHKSLKRIRVDASANGSGKTASAVKEAEWAARGTHPYRPNLPVPSKGIIVLDKPEKVADRWDEEIKKWMDSSDLVERKNGKPYVNEIVHPNGSTWHFMFHNQDPESFESIEADYIIYDEPPPRHIWVALSRSLRRVDNAWSMIVGTMLTQQWIYRELWKPWSEGKKPDVECFRTSVEVNRKHLGSKWIEDYKSILTEQEKKVRLEGHFGHFAGLALSDFSRSTHVVDTYVWPKNWPCVLAVDPHPNKAHHAILLGVTKFDQYVILKELSSGRAPKDFGEQLANFIKGYRVVDQVCDSIGATPTSGGWERLSFIEVVNKTPGVRLRTTTYREKSEDAWILDIKELLRLDKCQYFGRQVPGIIAFSNCVGTIDDFETVTWEKYRNTNEFKARLSMGSKDFLSCVKYAIATRLCYTNRSHIIQKNRPTSYGGRSN